MALFVISALPLRTGRKYISGMPLRVAGGQGYLAGEFPGGTTTVGGAPVTAEVRALWRDLNGTSADGVVVAKTQSAPDGTWILTGLNPALKYDVVGRKAGFNDVIVSNVTPTSMVDITYAGAVVENETFTGALGYLELVGGIPPYAASVVDPLPSGLFPVVNGRQLIIDGTTTDDDVFNSTVRITSSNGATKDVPVKLVVGFKAPANLEAETIEDAGAFSVVLTWEVTNSTQEVLVFKSATPFDLESMPTPIATLTGDAVSYTDDDVIEDDVFYYMTASVCESFTLYSDGVREVVNSGDPHWDNVVSLLHFDGDFTDETGRDWVGSGAFSYVGGKFGLGFKPSGGLVSTPSSSDLNLSTGDFTIECFMNLTGTSGLRALLSSGVRSWSVGNIYILVDGANRLEIGSFENGHIWISSATLPSSGVFHFGLTRLAGELRLFINGILVGSKLNSAPLNFSTNGTRIGVNAGEQNPFSGVIDELRITKGVARYTENFTPPTEPFPNK